MSGSREAQTLSNTFDLTVTGITGNLLAQAEILVLAYKPDRLAHY